MLKSWRPTSDRSHIRTRVSKKLTAKFQLGYAVVMSKSWTVKMIPHTHPHLPLIRASKFRLGVCAVMSKSWRTLNDRSLIRTRVDETLIAKFRLGEQFMSKSWRPLSDRGVTRTRVSRTLTAKFRLGET